MIAGPKVWNSLPSNIRAITNLLRRNSRLSFIGRLLCKAPVNLLETERYINFNIIIIIIIIMKLGKLSIHKKLFFASTCIQYFVVSTHERFII